MGIRDRPSRYDSHVELFVKFGKPSDVFDFMINRTRKQED